MNPQLINRILELVKKNGDRVVLADPESDRAVVVMDLDAYEILTEAAGMDEMTSGPPSELAYEPIVGQQARTPEPTPIRPVVQEASAPRQPAPKTLTDAPAPDTMKRDIGDWKTVGDVRPAARPAAQPVPQPQPTERPQTPPSGPANQNPVQPAPQPQPVTVGADRMEEEERFYLEPIE